MLEKMKLSMHSRSPCISNEVLFFKLERDLRCLEHCLNVHLNDGDVATRDTLSRDDSAPYLFVHVDNN